MANANRISHNTSSSSSSPPQPPPSNQGLCFKEKETGLYVHNDSRTKSDSALSTSSSPASTSRPTPTRRASFPQFENTRPCIGNVRTLDGDMTTMTSPPPPPPSRPDNTQTRTQTGTSAPEPATPDIATISHPLFNNKLHLSPHLSDEQTVTILINDSHAPKGKEFKVHRELLRFHSAVLRGVLGGADEEGEEEEEREIAKEAERIEGREGTTHRLQLKPRIWEWRWLELGILEEMWEREDREGEVCWVDVRVKLPPPLPTKPTTTMRRTMRRAQMKRKTMKKKKKKSGVALLKMRDVDGGLCGVRTWVAFEAWLYLGGAGLLQTSTTTTTSNLMHQHIRTLIHLWVFAGRIAVPACQNDCIEAIYFFQQKQRQKHHLNIINELPWVYRHTREYDDEEVVVKGCVLKKLLLDFWAWRPWGTKGREVNDEEEEGSGGVGWLEGEGEDSGDAKADLRVQRDILWDLVRVQQEMLGRKMSVWEEAPFGSRRRRREVYHLPVGEVRERR